MDKSKSNSRLFSGYFFANLFVSLTFSLLIFFLFIRLKSTENSFTDYFSKILTNFQVNFEQTVYTEHILNWFNPNLKAGEQEEYRKYKLSILAKTINIFFKNILVDVQNNVVNGGLKNFIENKSPKDLEGLKVGITKHLRNNPDIREVSTYDLNGNKIFGIKFKDSPSYNFNQEIIKELIQNKNLLLKRGEDKNLILLSTIEDSSKKPFLILSQSIHKDFFNRILKHLEINNDIFYIKDSNNFVLFDNNNIQNSDKTVPSQISYKVYNSLTQPEEKNLKINLNNISYSLGTIVKKNNIWGNLFALGFVLTTFLFSFFCIDFAFNQVKKILSWRQEKSDSYILDNELEPAFQKQELPIDDSIIPNIPEYDSSSSSRSMLLENHEEVKPLTLEQYLLRGKKDY